MVEPTKPKVLFFGTFYHGHNKPTYALVKEFAKSHIIDYCAGEEFRKDV
jgi:hypothetical protein